MGTLTDFWNQISNFLGIEAVETIVPKTKSPPKPLEPKDNVTPLPKKPIAEIEVEPIEPLTQIELIDPVPIGEQGRANRIIVLPAKEEPDVPFTKFPSADDYPAKIDFFAKDVDGENLEGTKVTFLDVTETTDNTGKCSISGRMKVRKNYPITASKAGFKTLETEISFASAPHPEYGTGVLGATKTLVMERI